MQALTLYKFFLDKSSINNVFEVAISNEDDYNFKPVLQEYNKHSYFEFRTAYCAGSKC